jgi:cell division septum initiation protein DivIVA
MHGGENFMNQDDYEEYLNDAYEDREEFTEKCMESWWLDQDIKELEWQLEDMEQQAWDDLLFETGYY